MIGSGIKLASDTAEQEGESRQAYKSLTAGKRKGKVGGFLFAKLFTPVLYYTSYPISRLILLDLTLDLTRSYTYSFLMILHLILPDPTLYLTDPILDLTRSYT